MKNWFLLIIVFHFSYLGAEENPDVTIEKENNIEELVILEPSYFPHPSTPLNDSEISPQAFTTPSIQNPTLYGSEENPEVSIEKENKTEEIAILEPSHFPQSLTPLNESSPLKELEGTPPTLTPPPTKSTTLAVVLSSLIPGLGHTYLGDFKTAGALFGSSGIGFGLAASGNEELELPGILALQSISFYSVYAAYRDARRYNKDFGLCYKMPTENFKELSLAPISLSILKKPEVWAGLIGALSIGSAIGYFAFQDAHIKCDISSENIQPVFALPVGIGEEAFFRGYLQSALSELATPVGGIVLSSLAFGASHIPNALLLEREDRWKYYSFSLPLITSLGAYFGWLTYKNQSLKESVAVHVWYDFAIFLASSLAVESAITRKPRFAISIDF